MKIQRVVKAALLVLCVCLGLMVRAVAETPDSRWFLAASQNDTAGLGSLKDAGADINQRNAEGKTALQVAIETQQRDAVLWLINQGADIETPIQLNQQAFPAATLVAAFLPDTELLSALQKRGETFLGEGPFQSTILHTLASIPATPAHAEVVTYLVRQGVPVDGIGHALAPLHLALHSNNAVVAKALIDSGANITQPVTLNGSPIVERTPLSLAASSGNKELVRLLLEKGADATRVVRFGETAMYFAGFAPQRGEDLELFQILMDAGASPTPDLIGLLPEGSPVHSALSEIVHKQQERIDTLYRLVETGDINDLAQMDYSAGELNYIDDEKLTPLHAAIRAGQPASVTWLLENGANADLDMGYRDSVEEAAVDAQNPQVLASFVRSGRQFRNHSKVDWILKGWYELVSLYIDTFPQWQPNPSDYQLDDAIKQLIQQQQLDLLVKLQQGVVDIASLAGFSFKPLNEAVKTGNTAVIKALLPIIPVNTDSYDHPLLTALERGNWPVVNLLSDAGWTLPDYYDDVKKLEWIQRDPELFAIFLCQQSGFAALEDVPRDIMLTHLPKVLEACTGEIENDNWTHGLVASVLARQDFATAAKMFAKGFDIDYVSYSQPAHIQQALEQNEIATLVFLIKQGGDLYRLEQAEFETLLSRLLTDPDDLKDAFRKRLELRSLGNNEHDMVAQAVLDLRSTEVLGALQDVGMINKALVRERCNEQGSNLDIQAFCVKNGWLDNDKTPLASLLNQSIIDVVVNGKPDNGTLKAVIEAGAELNGIVDGSGYYSYEKRTPLMLAVLYGRMELVEMLLAHGADPDNLQEQDSALTLSGLSANADLVKRIFLAADDINKLEQQQTRLLENLLTPPEFVADNASQREEAIRWLLQNGVAVPDDLFQQAAANGLAELVANLHSQYPQFQLSGQINQALIAAAGPYPKFALQHESEKRYLETLAMLLALGADPNAVAQGAFGSASVTQEGNVLTRALTQGTPAIVSMLLSKGAQAPYEFNGNWVTKGYGETLWLLVKQGHADLLGTLIEAGANPNATLEDGTNLIGKAVRENNVEAARILLVHGAATDSSGEDAQKTFPLWDAVTKDKLPMVRLLVEEGADPNQRNVAIRNQTPLMLALTRGQHDISEYLMRNGANLSAKDLAGKSIGQYVQDSADARLVALYNQARYNNDDAVIADSIRLYQSRITGEMQIHARHPDQPLSLRAGLGTDKYIAELWDESNQRPIRQISETEDYNELLAAHFFDQALLISFSGEPVRLVNTVDGSETAQFEGYTQAAALSVNKTWFAYADNDKTTVIDTRIWQPAAIIHTGLTSHLTVDDDGQAVRGVDGLQRLLTLTTTNKQIASFDHYSRLHLQHPTQMRKLDNQHLLLANRSGQYLWEWQVASRQVVTHYQGPAEEVKYLAVSEDGQSFAALTDSHVTIWQRGQSEPLSHTRLNDLGLAGYRLSGFAFLDNRNLALVDDHQVAMIPIANALETTLHELSFDGDLVQVIGALNGQLLMQGKDRIVRWYPAADPQTTVLPVEAAIVTAVVSDDKIYVVTDDNRLMRMSGSLEVVDELRLFADEQQANRCLEGKIIDTGAILPDESVVLHCRRFGLGEVNYLYQFNPASGQLSELLQSGGFYQAIVALESGKVLTLEGSNSSASVIKQFTLNNLISSRELIFQDQDYYEQGASNAIAFDSVDGRLYRQTNNGDIHITNIESGTLEEVIESDWELETFDLQVSHDSHWLARFSWSTLEVWNLNNGQRQSLIEHPYTVHAMAIAAGAGLILVGDEHGRVTAYDISTGEQRWQTPVDQEMVRDISLFDQGRKLVHTGKYFQIRDTATGQLLSRFKDGDAEPVAVFVDEANQQLVGMTRGFLDTGLEQESHWLQVFDMASGRLLESRKGTRLLAYRRDGQFAVYQTDGDKIFRRNHATNQETPLYYTAPSGWRESHLKLAGDMVIASDAEAIERIESDAGAAQLLAGYQANSAVAMTYSADAQWAMYTNGARQTFWFNTQSPNQIGCVNPLNSPLGDIRLDPESMALWLTGESGDTWTAQPSESGCRDAVATPQADVHSLLAFEDVKKPVKRYRNDVISMAVLSRQQDRLALSNDRQAMVLNLETGQLSQFMPHTAFVRGLQFSPSGEKLFTHSGNNRIKVWNGDAAALLFEGVVEHSTLLSVTFNQAEDQLTVVSQIATAYEKKIKGIFVDTVATESERVTQVFDLGNGQQLSVNRERGQFDDPVRELVRQDINGEEVTLSMTSAYAQFDWGAGNTVQADDSQWLVRGSYDQLEVWKGGTRPELVIPTSSIHHRLSAFIRGKRFIVSIDRTGLVNFYSSENGALTATFSLETDGQWLLTDKDGRYDASQPGDIPHAAWVADNAPFEALPIEVFIKDFFEPRLLPKVLSGETNFASRQLANLNRVRPLVTIDKLEQARDGTVTATLTVQEQAQLTEKDGKPVRVRSGINGVALFRDGRQVGFAPVKTEQDQQELASQTVVFDNIQLANNVEQGVTFSAYAFNTDNVKSQTIRMPFVPEKTASHTPRAYVINVGVNSFKNPAWNLNYASADADAIHRVLTDTFTGLEQFSEVRSIKLTTHSDLLKPSKALIQAVFDRLSGRKVEQVFIDQYPQLTELERVHPDDLVIFTYAGHGYAAPDGNFHIFPWDIAAGETRQVDDALLASTIDSAELETMLRGIDSEQFMMVIDACNSAASVEGRAFRPGPMGSSGLGQLAYNKKMIILTASQAEEFAVESDQLKHGLLTFSLIEEGLLSARADYLPKDNQVYAKEWFGYALKRVPDLYQSLAAGDFQATNSRGIRVKAPQQVEEEKKQVVDKTTQKPGVFDFWQSKDVVIAVDPRGD